jgi:hypothetical protein
LRLKKWSAAAFTMSLISFSPRGPLRKLGNN